MGKWDKIDKRLRTPEDEERERLAAESAEKNRILGLVSDVFRQWAQDLRDLQNKLAGFSAVLGFNGSETQFDLSTRGHTLAISRHDAKLTVTLDAVTEEIIYNFHQKFFALTAKQHDQVQVENYFTKRMEDFVELVHPA